MKKKISMLIVSIITIVLEALPYGAVLVFVDDGVTEIKRTFSYFDLTPYGYANFAPFVTAVLSCILCILCMLFLAVGNRKIGKAITVIAGSSTIISIIPLALGLEYITFTGVCVTLSMLILFVLSIIKGKADRNEKFTGGTI